MVDFSLEPPSPGCRLGAPDRPGYHHLGMVSGSWLPSLAQPDAAYTAYLPHGSHRRPLCSKMQPLCSQMQPLSSHMEPHGQPFGASEQPYAAPRAPKSSLCATIWGPWAAIIGTPGQPYAACPAICNPFVAPDWHSTLAFNIDIQH